MWNRSSCVVRLFCALAVASSASASAQVFTLPQPGYSDDVASLLSPNLLRLRSLKDARSPSYQGLAIGDWRLFPSLGVGAVFNDNVFGWSAPRIAAGGVGLQPRLLADRNAGIHHTLIYADGNFTMYPDRANADTTAARAGFGHAWEAQRDLVFKVGGEFDSLTMLSSNYYVISQLGLPARVVNLQHYNQFGGTASVMKSFDRLFTQLSVTSFATDFAALSTTTGSLAQNYRNNVTTAVAGRVGFAISPAFYLYSEAKGNVRTYDNSAAFYPHGTLPIGASYGSHGYRAVAGLGTDRLSLFRGEIYAGYQQQFYNNSSFGSPAVPLAGGKISWYPTRDWTVSASLDRTFQDSALATVGNPYGSPAEVTSATLSLGWAISRRWSASVDGGYMHLTYVNGGRRDAIWRSSTTLNYEITGNLLAMVNHSFIADSSNAFGGGFTRNQVSLGAQYKY